MQVEDSLPRVERHHRLFEAGVAGPFADAVDGDFDLPCPVLHSRKRVCGRQAQVVVAVDAENDVLAAFHVLAQIADQLAELFGRGVADGVGDVQRRRAGPNGDGQHLDQELGVAAAGVFGAELDVVAQAAGVLHHVADRFEHLVGRHAQLVLHVDFTGGEEGVDARPHRALDRLPGFVDVVLVGPGQAGDDGRRAGIALAVDAWRAANGQRDSSDRIQVAGRRGREAGLHDVDAEA